MDSPPQRASGNDIDALLSALTLDEKAALTAGEDLWSLPAIERAGISKLVMTDGPNGARGPGLPGQTAASTTCVPCGSALGATWDPDLASMVGELLGQEARSHGCQALLAPTVNIPRSPLAGRNFECYSEDPLLSGRLAAAFVQGVQSSGVASVIKHFVANDAETDRMTSSSVVDERTLRELYLLPFEIAVREGGGLGLMTGYNRVNGIWCSEHADLISLARDEWGFAGVVVTDWFAVASTEGSSAAGLDVEMPGPGRAYGAALAQAVRDGRVPERSLDTQVRRVLSVLDQLGLIGGDRSGGTTPVGPLVRPPAGPPVRPPVRPPAERRRSLAYRAAAESFVLLKNDGLLPLGSDLRRLAVIGESAGDLTIMGGGSAQVHPDLKVSFLDALRERLGATVDVGYEPGMRLARSTPVLDVPMSIELFRGESCDGPVVDRKEQAGAELLYLGAPHPAIDGPFSVRARGTFTAAADGMHTFTLTEAGRARLLVDGQPLLDGMDGSRPRGPAFFGTARAEIAGKVELAKGQHVSVDVEYCSGGRQPISAFRIGCQPPEKLDLGQAAEDLAGSSDAVVLVVGTTEEWESEGFDRDSLALPADQDDLIDRVLARNSHTVVVVNAGSPVAMAWADQVPAILQGWLAGQEMGAALADVLVGSTEPGGRLPVTIPEAIEQTPAYGNFPGDGDSIVYGERLLVGYKWYQTRGLPVRFPFGHGLSFTTFAIGPPALSKPRWTPGDVLEITLGVANTGSRAGSEVVQCYVEPPRGPVFRPARELKAFCRVNLPAGERTEVTLRLDGRSFAHWHQSDARSAELRSRLAVPFLASASFSSPSYGGRAGWRVEAGTYQLHLGRSSADITWSLPIEVDEAFLGS